MPLAEPVQPAAPQAAPWAEPVAAHEAEPLMEAEIVYPAASYAEPIQPMPQADDLYPPSGAYGNTIPTGPLIRPLPPRSARPTSPARERPGRGTRRYPRPLGIFLLALFHFLVGAIIMVSGLFGGALGLASRHSPASALVACAFLGSLIVAFGVGLFLGVRWVWWLEAFGLAFGICGNAISIVLALVLPLIPGLISPMFGALSALIVFRYLTEMVFHSLLLAYLFKENVLAFFGLKRLDTGQALGILFGIAFSLMLVFTGIGLILLRGRLAPERPSQAAPAPPKPAPVSNEPAPSGYPLTIWGATKRSSSNEFSLEYRLDHGPLDAGRQYFWIVKGAQQKVEFPIPASLWKSRDKLSGKPDKLAPGEFAGPYTTFIEEQVGGTRSRISNDSPVVIDGN